MSDLSFGFAYTFILASCVVGFIFGMWNWWIVNNIIIL